MIERDLFGYPILPKIDILRIPYMGSKNSKKYALEQLYINN
jgi:hypothetical protein